MNTIRDDVTNALNAAQAAIAELSRVLSQALAQVNDISEENQRLHAANQSLTDQNGALRDQVSSAQSELWQTKRERDDITRDRDSAKAELETLRKQLEEAKAEAVKLREVILNVAAATDAIVNPRPVPEVTPTPPVTDTPAQSYQSQY